MIIDTTYYATNGYGSTPVYQLPEKAIPHLIEVDEEEVKRDGWGYARNRRMLCDKDGKKRFVSLHSRAEWHKTIPEDKVRICARCWSIYWKAKGEPAPEQYKRPGPSDKYDYLDVVEVVRIGDGQRFQPKHIIVEKKDRTYWWTTLSDGTKLFRERAPRAVFDRDLRSDGELKLYNQAPVIGVQHPDPHFDDRGHERQSGYAYYDPDREAAASEVRSEIQMLKRRLKEAEEHLLEVYCDDPTHLS